MKITESDNISYVLLFLSFHILFSACGLSKTEIEMRDQTKSNHLTGLELTVR